MKKIPAYILPHRHAFRLTSAWARNDLAIRKCFGWQYRDPSPGSTGECREDGLNDRPLCPLRVECKALFDATPKQRHAALWAGEIPLAPRRVTRTRGYYSPVGGSADALLDELVTRLGPPPVIIPALGVQSTTRWQRANMGPFFVRVGLRAHRFYLDLGGDYYVTVLYVRHGGPDTLRVMFLPEVSHLLLAEGMTRLKKMRPNQRRTVFRAAQYSALLTTSEEVAKVADATVRAMKIDLDDARRWAESWTAGQDRREIVPG